MESAEILERARANEESPQGWIVLPLLRNKVVVGIVGWVFGAIMGFGLFALAASVMIPHNFESGAAGAVISTIILGVVLFVGAGSLWAIIIDVVRLLHADKHIIVITPDEFVKQEGEKIIHVPLMYVRHVTARGVPPPDRTVSRRGAIDEVSGAGENFAGFLFGRGLIPSGRRQRRGRRRTPTTLAFIDSRTDSEVVVATDGSYGDPFTIAALLKEYAAHVQQLA